MLLGVGAAGTALLRPHMAVLLFAALVVAQLFRPEGHAVDRRPQQGRGLVVLAAAAVVLTSQSASFLGIDDFTWQAVSDSVDQAAEPGERGWVRLRVHARSSLRSTFPSAVVTVLFRPFPWEARNVQMLVQSLEGLLPPRAARARLAAAAPPAQPACERTPT